MDALDLSTEAQVRKDCGRRRGQRNINVEAEIKPAHVMCEGALSGLQRAQRSSRKTPTTVSMMKPRARCAEDTDIHLEAGPLNPVEEAPA